MKERNPEIGKPEPSAPLFEQDFYKFEQQKTCLTAPLSAQGENGDCGSLSDAQSLGGSPRDKAHARNSDPETSHAASRSVVNIGRVREQIRELFKAFPKGMTDEQMIYFFREMQRVRTDWKNASDSGLRSRRSELVTLGFVEDSGELGKTEMGNPAIIWRLRK